MEKRDTGEDREYNMERLVTGRGSGRTNVGFWGEAHLKVSKITHWITGGRAQRGGKGGAPVVKRGEGVVRPGKCEK